MCIGSPKSVTPLPPPPVPPPPPAEETPKVMQPAVEKTADKKKKQMQGRSALKVDLQPGGGASGRSGLMIPT